MPVEITCRKVELPEELRELTIKKSRRLKRFFEKVDRIEVIFSAEKFRRQCEIIVHAGPLVCAAKAENGNEGAAFDKALKAAERQIKDSKTKMKSRKGRTSTAHAMAAGEELLEEAM